MNTRRIYVYFALIFLLGILAGGAGAFFYGWHMMGPQGRVARRDRILRHMTRKLDLNSSQIDQIRAIMDDTGDKIEALRKQHRPEYESVLVEARDQMRKVMTPEQITTFNEMIRKFDERRKNRPAADPPPPPPPDE